MRTHVDVVRNSLDAQRRVAIVRVENDAVVVEPRGAREDSIVGSLTREYYDHEALEWVYARATPQRFVRDLNLSLHGTYSFATDAHDDDACPFADSDTLPVEVIPVDRTLRVVPS